MQGSEFQARRRGWGLGPEASNGSRADGDVEETGLDGNSSGMLAEKLPKERLTVQRHLCNVHLRLATEHTRD